MKSYTLRPDTFTLNFNLTLSGKLNAGVNFYNYYKGLSHTGYEPDEHLYNIQCSEIFTLRNENLHTEA